MTRGIYTAATGMNVQRERMDIVTNNIVNAETTGYKSDALITQTFDEVMLERINDPNISINGTDAGGYSFGTHVSEKVTDFNTGSLEQTYVSTDLAIDGNGFFVIETEAGERYTKNGNFLVNSQGFLVTSDGNYVLGENGRIMVGSGNFQVAYNGRVTGADALEDTLRIVTFEDNGVLRKQGDNLYYGFDGAQPVEDNQSIIRQGFQENSNVNVADEMVELITLYRKYEANQKAVTMNDETIGMAASKIGTL